MIESNYPEYLLPIVEELEDKEMYPDVCDVAAMQVKERLDWDKVQYGKTPYPVPFNRKWIKQRFAQFQSVALPEPCQLYEGWARKGSPFVKIYARKERRDYTGLGAHDMTETPSGSMTMGPKIRRMLKAKHARIIRFTSPSILEGSVERHKTPQLCVAGLISEEMFDVVPHERHNLPDIEYYRSQLPQFPTTDDDKQIMRYVTSATDVNWISRDTEEDEAKVCYLWQRDYRPSPIIPVGIDQEERRLAMFDTGATATLISYSWFTKVKQYWSEAEFKMRKCFRTPRVFGISGAELEVVGKFLLTIKIGRGIYPHEVVVIKAPGEEFNPTNHRIDMIIGVDFMRLFRVFVGFGLPTRIGPRDFVFVENQRFRTTEMYDPTIT